MTTVVQTRQIAIAASTIALAEGERYAGSVLDEQGHHLHHLVLMAPRPGSRLHWQAAMDWAASVGGALPNRQEQALLYANCKPHLQPTWHWTSEALNSSSAWYCGFNYGYQYVNPKSYEGSAVAVRRSTRPYGLLFFYSCVPEGAERPVER